MAEGWRVDSVDVCFGASFDLTRTSTWRLLTYGLVSELVIKYVFLRLLKYIIGPIPFKICIPHFEDTKDQYLDE